jgi:HD-like signal output (HDOD) protein
MAGDPLIPDHHTMTIAPSDDKTGDALKAQRFQMLEDIAKELAGDVVFPTAFDLVIRLRKALQDPDLSIDRLAELIGLDPLISARLIGMANSAAYSRGGPKIQTVKSAVQRLGINAVRNAVLAIAMNQLLRAKDLVPFSDFADRLWRHSLRAAAAAAVVARQMTRIGPDEALLAGLVHDLGAFYMLYRAARYPELVARPESLKYLITQWHENIGHTLLLALGLPEAVADAMRDHDTPRQCPQPPRSLADVVYVANLLAEARFEWLYHDNEAGPVHGSLGTDYVALTDEIDAREQEMRAVIG